MAILLSDASSPGKFRYQLFDAKGFISHHVENTLEKALEGAFSSGYTQIDKDALDRVASTREWARGMEIQGIRDLYNYGKISWEDLFKEIEKIDSKFQDAA